MFLDDQNWSHGDTIEAVPVCEPHTLPDTPSRSAAPKRPLLTGLEQRVVALSLFDHPASIDPPGRVVRLLSWIGGSRSPNQLADDRLEALRRYCILLRESDAAPATAEYDKVRAACFSEAALLEAGALVARGRAAAVTAGRIGQARLPVATIARRVGGTALGGGVLAAMFAWLAQYLGDALFALIVTLMLSITMAPWLIPADDRQRR